MKKILVLVAVSLVGISSLLAQPASLPIGSSERIWRQLNRQIDVVSFVLQKGDARVASDPIYLTSPPLDWIVTPVHANISIQDLNNLVQTTGKDLIQKNLTLENEGEIFTLNISAYTERVEDGGILGQPNVFTVSLDANGAIILPSMSLGNLFVGYTPVELSGVFWVKLSYFDSKGDSVPVQSDLALTRNGASTNCVLAQNYGNGVLYFPSQGYTGDDFRKLGFQVTVTLYFNEEMTHYAVYDVMSLGQRIDLVRPNKISITPTAGGMSLQFPNPKNGKGVTIQVSEDLINWSDLTTLTGSSFNFSFVDTNHIGSATCFYRLVQ